MTKTWVTLAACRGHDPELFFPTSDERTPKGVADRLPARRICGGCPVRGECLTYALDAAPHGVWGGTTEAERRAIRRARRTATAPPGPLVPAA